MKNKKPHGLNIGCSYEILGGPKVKLKTAKMEGWITMGEGRTKVVIPFRSWVKQFLDRFHNIMDGTAANTEIATASNGASTATNASVCDRYGIVIGYGDTAVQMTDTALADELSESTQTQFSTTTLVKPTQNSNRELTTAVRRLFSNASSAGIHIYEIGMYLKKTASTASNAGNYFVARDVVTGGELFDALSDTRVEIALKAQLPVTGGPLLNLLRVFYNLFFAGNANAAPWVPRSGTFTLSHAIASSTSSLVVDGGAGKYWGIMVGYRDKNLDEVDINGDNNISTVDPYLYTTEVTYGANTVSSVVQAGNKASFYVTRDITNSGTSNVKIERMGLLTKGATAAPTALQNDQCFLCLNKPSELDATGLRNQILLAPNQTLRVTYTFEIYV